MGKLQVGGGEGSPEPKGRGPLCSACHCARLSGLQLPGWEREEAETLRRQLRPTPRERAGIDPQCLSQLGT